MIRLFKPVCCVVGMTLFFMPLRAQKKTIDQKVDSVLKLMTLDEKIGQLNQYSGKEELTGPESARSNLTQEIKGGKVGSMLNVRGAERTRKVQELTMQSRLKIPLIFGQDVIHGYKVTFPIPLAEAASWDTGAIELGARVAATEAAASGLHWTFAPMVDIARDPRWGRVMEGAGEDPFLGSVIARARVRGFQGKGLGNLDAVMACAKHFAAYGAAIGGRDYNSVDMSERTLWEVYLPPFKAAAEAGAATFMNSFNDLNGVPATGNAHLQRDILKGAWKFKGFVVSDWGSIGEMVDHGYVKDKYEAALSAITAGSDMDMESRSYITNLSKLVKGGQVPVAQVDEAVKRILRKKFELGLFDDPYRFSNVQREQQAVGNQQHRTIAREMAQKSIVLLKNEKNLLPLSKDLKKIALIGPLAKSETDMLGFWNVSWPDNSDVVSQWEGLANKVGTGTQLIYAKGCEVNDTSRAGFAEAIAAAQAAEVVIVSVGELRDMSGEAKSRASLHLPGVQEELVRELQATGKPVVVLINAGRPLVFNWMADHVPAILYTWWLGSEAGTAIANVLFGEYNPSGKLPMTFPRAEGQVPIYYNYLNTGRPAPDDEKPARYRSGYIDMQKSPRYAFGHGLSYTTFGYSNLALNKSSMNGADSIVVTFTLTNTGNRAGEEVAQLYLRDNVASVVRPVKELKDFTKMLLQPGESRTIRFVINKEKLSFYNQKLQWDAEPGTFDLLIGSASDDIRLRSNFELRGKQQR